MTVDLTTLLVDAQAWLWAGFVIFLRVGAVIGLAPAFGEQSVPVRVKLALSLCFTLLVVPATPVPLPPPDFVETVALCGAEVLTGLLLGLIVRLYVLGLQTAGSIAAQSASISQLFGGGAGTEPMPAIGHLLVIGGLTLAAIMGLHIQLTRYLMASYALVPPGKLPLPGTVLMAGLDQIGRIFGLGFTLAAPFVAAALIYNLVLGVINRAMPTLMVTLVGAPALTLGALGLLTLAAPLILGAWVNALSGHLAQPFGPP